MDSVAEGVSNSFLGVAGDFGLPGLAWWVSNKDRTWEGSYQPPLNEGEPNRNIDPAQRWHWGSCTKALTTTTVASIVDQGLLSWETTVGSVPELKDTPAAGVTLKQLCLHRSGLTVDLDDVAESKLKADVGSQPVVAQRLEFAKRLCALPLQAPPGSKFCYSNAGFALISVVVEVLLKKPWEQIVHEHIAIPLAISVLFGVPKGLAGHNEEGDPQPDYEDHPWNHSAFSANSTLADWGKFVKFHLQTLQSHSTPGAEHPFQAVKIGPSAKLLHTPASPAVAGEEHFGSDSPKAYSMGWYGHWTDEDEQTFTLEPTKQIYHFGTNFVFNAASFASKDHDLAVVVGSNSGSMVARLAIRMALENLINVFDPPK